MKQSVFEALGVQDIIERDSQKTHDIDLVLKKYATQRQYTKSDLIIDSLNIAEIPDTPENRTTAALFFILGSITDSMVQPVVISL